MPSAASAIEALTATFPQAFGRAIAIIVMGALIGFFIGLVSELLKRGWLMVVRSGKAATPAKAASIRWSSP